jgi:hypothetical protein
MLSIRGLSRFSAAGLHFAVSFTIAMMIAMLMYFVWYPAPLFFAMGGATLFMLIVGIDVTLGPLITLIIFDTRKKSLEFDISVVLLVQLAALIYGIYAMYSARPVFTVFTGQDFAVVAAAEIEPDDLAKVQVEEFKHLSLLGPRLVSATTPSDPNEQSKVSLSAAFGGGIQLYPQYFVPYANKLGEVVKSSLPLNELKTSPEDKIKLENYLSHNKLKQASLSFLPVATRNGDLTALLDTQGNLLTILDVRPIFTASH